MRILAYSAAAIIPILFAAALVVGPGDATNAPTAAPSARVASSFADYVPPSHVRVIPITATSR